MEGNLDVDEETLRELENDAVIKDNERENELAAKIAAEFPQKYGENAPLESNNMQHPLKKMVRIN